LMVIDRGCVPRTPATTARPSLHQPTGGKFSSISANCE
ncbi:hypothetical protein T03_13913, partial [Trichinella britovi]